MAESNTMKNTKIIVGRQNIQNAYGVGRKVLDKWIKNGAIVNRVSNIMYIHKDEFENSLKRK